MKILINILPNNILFIDINDFKGICDGFNNTNFIKNDELIKFFGDFTNEIKDFNNKYNILYCFEDIS